ncbi:MAG: hypothetical protein AB7F36_15835 [Reyranellaceae bacterium]
MAARIVLAVLLLAAGIGASSAQTPRPLTPQDAVLAYEAAQVSRSAIRDQLDLCAADADKLEQVFSRLRPEAGSEAGDWREWGELYAQIGRELLGCLRAYAKQRSLHLRDVALMRERLPLMKQPKRLTLSPKQVAKINAYSAGLERELAGYDRRAMAIANGAENSSAKVADLLRAAGASGVDLPTGFAADL